MSTRSLGRLVILLTRSRLVTAHRAYLSAVRRLVPMEINLGEMLAIDAAVRARARRL